MVDKETKAVLIGVTVMVSDMAPAPGTATNDRGEFSLDSIPVGKHDITLSYMGYEGRTLRDVLVTSAKEVILPLEMEERVVKMNDVVVTRKREHINDMALASTRTFDVQETERYAGSRSDPARMSSNFAGAQGGDDSRNDIVIRGNSPQGVLWRMEGVDIPNPNHFNIPGTTGGPVSMLNSKLLANSDLFMGAFPAEYGDAVAGVFDVRLRNGNNKKYEFTGQLGLLGTEALAEGPISRKAGSSFLVNYRYSTLQIFQGLGIKVGTTSIPQYQDASFKLNFPMGKKGDLSFFGLGGLSRIDLIVSTLTEPEPQLYGESDRDQYFKAGSGVVGGTYGITLNDKNYMKFTIAQSASNVWALHTKVFRNASFAVDSMKDVLGYDFNVASTVAHWYINKKISPRQTLKYGIVNKYYSVSFLDSSRQYPTSRQDWQLRENYKGGTDLVQAYIQYKLRPSEVMTLTGGLHAQYLTHNGSKALEPRAGMRWAASGKDIVTAGYGLHSQVQPLYQYFAHLPQDPPGIMQNYNVDFTRSHHFVAGYERILGPHLRLRTEAYGQYLYNVPIERRIGSSYSGLNQGSTFSRNFPDTMQNTGTGYNYGIEATLEKTFSKGFYLLLTGSAFDSKAAGNDGVYRNTDYNTQYAVNLLLGYEKKIGKYSTLTTGAKATTIGGKLYSPVDVAASNALGDIVVVDSQRNSLRFAPYYRVDLKLGIRINAKRLTHEIAVDLVNVANTKNILSLTYSSDLAAQGVAYPFYTQYQLGFLPIFYYRLDL
ncbi:carboxypeptidase-like regulatory domain-containing protein [Nemorincola caseinilytica]|uniref:Carboxypeptidase-like regulatory domain-containing protein n=1 Tax=Nemorincola caseinilytica TaxID=2054315 RepID=A0ABP8N2D4_9BACT